MARQDYHDLYKEQLIELLKARDLKKTRPCLGKGRHRA